MATLLLNVKTIGVRQAITDLGSLTRLAESLAAAFVEANLSLERTEVLLTGVRGSADGSAQAMDYLVNMTTRAPFAVNALTDSFTRLQIAGLDPMSGSLDTITNAISAFGGTSSDLKLATIAIQQMAGKGVISMEELRRQLSERVPTAIRDMAQGLGLSYKELVDKVGEGNQEATEAITAMLGVWEEKFAGSNQRLRDTMAGTVSYATSQWQVLLRDLGKQGTWDSLTEVVEGIGNTLEELRVNEDFSENLKDLSDTAADFLLVLEYMASKEYDPFAGQSYTEVLTEANKIKSALNARIDKEEEVISKLKEQQQILKQQQADIINAEKLRVWEKDLSMEENIYQTQLELGIDTSQSEIKINELKDRILAIKEFMAGGSFGTERIKELESALRHQTTYYNDPVEIRVEPVVGRILSLDEMIEQQKLDELMEFEINWDEIGKEASEAEEKTRKFNDTISQLKNSAGLEALEGMAKYYMEIKLAASYKGLEQEWDATQIEKYRQALLDADVATGKFQETLIEAGKASNNAWAGVNAELLDFLENIKTLGQLGSELTGHFISGLRGTLSAAFRGEFDGIKDIWKSTLDDMAQSLADWAADQVIEFGINAILGGESGIADELKGALGVGGPTGSANSPFYVIPVGGGLGAQEGGMGSALGEAYDAVTSLFGGSGDTLSTMFDTQYGNAWDNAATSISTSFNASLDGAWWNTPTDSIVDSMFDTGQSAWDVAASDFWSDAGKSYGNALSSYSSTDAFGVDMSSFENVMSSVDKTLKDSQKFIDNFDVNREYTLAEKAQGYWEIAKPYVGAATSAYGIYSGLEQGGVGGYLQAAGGLTSLSQNEAVQKLVPALNEFSTAIGTAGTVIGVAGGAYGTYQGIKEGNYVGAATSAVQTYLQGQQLYQTVAPIVTDYLGSTAGATAISAAASTAASSAAATGGAYSATSAASAAAQLAAAESAAGIGSGAAAGSLGAGTAGGIGIVVGVLAGLGQAIYDKAKKETREYRYGDEPNQVFEAVDVYKDFTEQQALWYDTMRQSERALDSLEGLSRDYPIEGTFEGGQGLTQAEYSGAMGEAYSETVNGFFDNFEQRMQALVYNFDDEFAKMALSIEPTLQGFDSFIDSMFGFDVAMEQSNDLMNQAILASHGNADAIDSLSTSLIDMGLDASVAEIGATALASAARDISPVMQEAALSTAQASGQMDQFSDSIYGLDQAAGESTYGLTALEQEMYGLEGSAQDAASGIAGMFAGLLGDLKSRFNPGSPIYATGQYNADGAVYSYHARGGIMDRPTVFHIGGEAGSEAILPLHNGPNTLKLIEDKIDSISSRPININIVGDEAGLKRFVKVEADAHVTDKLSRDQGTERVAY